MEERVGPEPLVLDGLAGVGKYGGTWFRVETSAFRVDASNRRMSCSYFFRQSPQGFPIVPHIAKSWESSDDKRIWTMYLRKGARWSDGHPFTADDIVYKWSRDLEVSGAAPTYSKWMKAAGQPGRAEKVDDYTVRFVFPVPNLLFPEMITFAISFQIYAPRHYLEPYHPIYGDRELIEATMKARNLTTPESLYTAIKIWSNPKHPRMWPWIFRTHTLNPPFVFVRNPYYFAVDTAGNQLPYIDRIFYDLKPPELLPAAAAGGNITMQAFNIQFMNYTMLMSERESGNYEVFHWYPSERSQWTIHPNLNRYVDPEDPTTKHKRELLSDVRFRRAASLAINRQQIINAVFYGIGEPAQTAPGPGSFFHSEHLYRAYTEFDPREATRLLDEIGLTRYDREGYRTFKDGKRMTWFLEMSVSPIRAPPSLSSMIGPRWAYGPYRGNGPPGFTSFRAPRGRSILRLSTVRTASIRSSFRVILRPITDSPVSPVVTASGIGAAGWTEIRMRLPAVGKRPPLVTRCGAPFESSRRPTPPPLMKRCGTDSARPWISPRRMYGRLVSPPRHLSLQS